MKWSERVRQHEAGEDAYSGKPRAAYHKFFEGYTEAKVPKKNGHGEKIIRRYTAPWKQPNLSRKAWIGRKIAAALLVLAAAALTGVTLFHGASAHNAVFIVPFEMLAILSFILLMTALFTYLTARYRMTLWEYKSGSRRLILFGKIASVPIGLTGTAILVQIVMTVKTGVSGNILSMVSAFCACGLLALLSFSESKVEYLDIPNDTEKPEKGREIWLE